MLQGRSLSRWSNHLGVVLVGIERDTLHRAPPCGIGRRVLVPAAYTTTGKGGALS